MPTLVDNDRSRVATERNLADEVDQMKPVQQIVDEMPKQLPGGLLLRWATQGDVDELAAFNLAQHSDDPDEPEQFLAYWTRDLMSGIHPTTSVDDFTVVVDPNDGNRIVSSLCTISQTWSYEGIPVPVGRPELVATHPDYRRRGLVREQMAIIHAKSALRGEIMNVITGIPWYYRQFGYEMAVEIGGTRRFAWTRPGNDIAVTPEPYTMRLATADDIPTLDKLAQWQDGQTLLTRVRSEAEWTYEIVEAHPESAAHWGYELITLPDGTPVGYISLETWDDTFDIQEIGVAAGHSWREVALFLSRELRRRADEMNETRSKPIANVAFILGSTHPVYDALGNQLEQPTRPYSYYVRVPDIPGFLRHIQPVLERRVAGSVLAGFTGSLKINLYREQFELVWANGMLSEIRLYEEKELGEGDVRFPDLTFLQILFGHRSYEELHRAFTDCYASGVQARLLTEILFPKKPSHVLPLN